MLRRSALVLLAGAVLAASGGCVYYNTFYHAKAAAREAELLREARPHDTEPTLREMELLERVIEKSGRVLRLHPDSSWADDALLLLGAALYHKGQYESAEARLTEFIARYPDSELRREAEFALAGVMLESGNPVSAEELLTEIAYADPPVALSDDALLFVGDARRDRNRREAAAEAYLELLDRFPGSRLRAEARFRAAENFSEMGRPEDAAPQYAAVAEEAGGRELLFEARLRLADAHMELDDPDAALAVLRDLEGRTTVDEDLDDVLLRVGRAQTLAGDLDDAVATYEGIAASRARAQAAGEAHYRIGLIHRDLYRDLPAASAAFEKAKSQAPRSDVAKQATDAEADLIKLRDHLADIAEHEGRGEAPQAPPVEPTEESAAPAGDLPVSSLEDTTALAVPPVTAGADTTALAAPPVTAGADTTALAVPPVTAGADTTALAAAAAPDSVDLEPYPDISRARFRAGELYLFKLNDPVTALEYYADVVALHPLSDEAPKAALAVAWILENRLDDPTGAEEAYARVADAYRGTKYAAAALEAMGLPADSDGTTTPSEPELERAPVSEPAADAAVPPEPDPAPSPESEPASDSAPEFGLPEAEAE
ncbi:MAG: tetratricopeptide repeat protein [Candidatus Eisenbacteria bacterium]